MSRTIIISPSGKLYGSEQVLEDYLNNTQYSYDVHVSEEGLFLKKLKSENLRHTFKGFDPKKLQLFYLKVFFLLLFKSNKTIYCNEGGHVKYIHLLALIFRSSKFFLHIRLIEDTKKERFSIRRLSNVSFIATSNFIKNLLPAPSTLLYDPYHFETIDKVKTTLIDPGVLRVGIIGRICKTKGVWYLIELIEAMAENQIKGLKFFIYGDMDAELLREGWEERMKQHTSVVSLMGFEKEKKLIYNNIDSVLHLSDVEALGRIFLEAISYNLPFIGFDGGGIGEIGKITGLTKLLIRKEDGDIINKMIDCLDYVKNNYTNCVEAILVKKQVAIEKFNINSYTKTLDNFLNK